MASFCFGKCKIVQVTSVAFVYACAVGPWSYVLVVTCSTQLIRKPNDAKIFDIIPHYPLSLYPSLPALISDKSIEGSLRPSLEAVGPQCHVDLRASSSHLLLSCLFQLVYFLSFERCCCVHIMLVSCLKMIPLFIYSLTCTCHFDFPILIHCISA